MKRIGILSDTHGFIDETIFDHFNDCDEIWHAGDFGSIELVNQLSEYKKILGVYGNIDDKAIRLKFPETLTFEQETIRVLMIHIAGSPLKYNKQVKAMIADYKPQILICGHSHILRVIPDKSNNLIYINPGACGHHGFHSMRTILKIDLNNGKIENLRVIELGKRGRN